MSERRSLRILRISASAYLYQRRPDRNVELRNEIVRLAHRHKRYGASMIGLKLRQSGWRVNHIDACLCSSNPKIIKIKVSHATPAFRLCPKRCGRCCLRCIVFLLDIDVLFLGRLLLAFCERSDTGGENIYVYMQHKNLTSIFGGVELPCAHSSHL